MEIRDNVQRFQLFSCLFFVVFAGDPGEKWHRAPIASIRKVSDNKLTIFREKRQIQLKAI